MEEAQQIENQQKIRRQNENDVKFSQTVVKVQKKEKENFQIKQDQAKRLQRQENNQLNYSQLQKFDSQKINTEDQIQVNQSQILIENKNKQNGTNFSYISRLEQNQEQRTQSDPKLLQSSNLVLTRAPTQHNQNELVKVQSLLSLKQEKYNKYEDVSINESIISQTQISKAPEIDLEPQLSKCEALTQQKINQQENECQISNICNTSQSRIELNQDEQQPIIINQREQFDLQKLDNESSDQIIFSQNQSSENIILNDSNKLFKQSTGLKYVSDANEILNISQLTKLNKSTQIKRQDNNRNEDNRGQSQVIVVNRSQRPGKTEQWSQNVQKAKKQNNFDISMLQKCNDLCKLIELEDEEAQTELNYNPQDNKIRKTSDVQKDSKKQQNQYLVNNTNQLIEEASNPIEITELSDKIRQYIDDIQNLKLCIQTARKYNQLIKQDNLQQYATTDIQRLGTYAQYLAQNEQIRSLEQYSEYLNQYIQEELVKEEQMSIRDILQINVDFLTDTQIKTDSQNIELFINFLIRSKKVYLFNTDLIEENINQDKINELMQNDFYITINKNFRQDLQFKRIEIV